MDQENTLVITKSRCPKVSGGVFRKPGGDLAELLRDWLSETTAGPVGPPPPEQVPVAAPRQDISESNAQAVTSELATIWKRMCSPRGVLHEFEELRNAVEALAGPAGLAEYDVILSKHGVEHAKQFKSSQPARLCAKDVYLLLEQLRANARENQSAAPEEMQMEPLDAGAIGGEEQ
jgi:hypothetical protein